MVEHRTAEERRKANIMAADVFDLQNHLGWLCRGVGTLGAGDPTGS